MLKKSPESWGYEYIPYIYIYMLEALHSISSAREEDKDRNREREEERFWQIFENVYLKS